MGWLGGNGALVGSLVGSLQPIGQVPAEEGQVLSPPSGSIN